MKGLEPSTFCMASRAEGQGATTTGGDERRSNLHGHWVRREPCPVFMRVAFSDAHGRLGHEWGTKRCLVEVLTRSASRTDHESHQGHSEARSGGRAPRPTGLRPAEWAAIERRDVDKTRRVVLVRGTKTHKSRREVPLTTTALAALNEVPPRLDSRYVFTTSRKCPGRDEPGPFDVANFRRRVWAPAIDSAGVAKPARIYDLRSTFISNALANGLTVFETARIAGTSVKMIEQHYGALLDTAHDSMLERLEASGARA
jgi:integrase